MNNQNNPVFGRHHAKINAQQNLSGETRAHLEKMDISRVGLGPGDLAISKWNALGLRQPDLKIIRRYRLERIREQLRAHDYAGIVVAEYPSIYYLEDWPAIGSDGVLEAGMVVCVESYAGRVGGRVKLEEQVLITEDGFEVLTNYPFEKDLLA